jgi:hypothetical protein
MACQYGVGSGGVAEHPGEGQDADDGGEEADAQENIEDHEWFLWLAHGHKGRGELGGIQWRVVFRRLPPAWYTYAGPWRLA